MMLNSLLASEPFTFRSTLPAADWHGPIKREIICKKQTICKLAKTNRPHYSICRALRLMKVTIAPHFETRIRFSLSTYDIIITGEQPLPAFKRPIRAAAASHIVSFRHSPYRNYTYLVGKRKYENFLVTETMICDCRAHLM
jgi:hypothetical protein